MSFYIENGNIVVENTDTFDIGAILECGQVFRYGNEGGEWSVTAGDRRAFIKKEGNKTIIRQNDENFFVKYFDLHRNYDIIVSELEVKSPIRAAVEYGKGIRILNQEPFETLISFIISANNHIPRIKSIIERLSFALGRDCGGYYAFPSPQAMAGASVDFYRSIGAGYRAEYLKRTAAAVADGFDLEALYGMDSEEARAKLLSLNGVGPKVADCILLFAYGKTDVFPVDTWIKKVFMDMYGDNLSPVQMSRRLSAEFKNLSGYAQQYLFYYKRATDKKY